MSVLVRPATRVDTRQMAEIAGGATTARDLADWMDDLSAHAAWYIAEDDTGALLGFQRVGASKDLANDISQIATFLRIGVDLSIGSRLFEATQRAARLLGYAWIDAKVAGGNESARIYYQSHGFRVSHRSPEYVVMRFELDRVGAD